MKDRSEEEDGTNTAGLKANVQAVADAAVLIDDQGDVTLVNSAFTALFGYQQEEILTRHVSLLWADRELFDSRGQPRLDFSVTGDPGAAVIHYRKKDGSTFAGATSGSIVRDDQGNPVGLLDVIRHVTVDQINQPKFETLLESAPIGIVITGRDGCINLANAEIERIFGYRREELIGEYIEILLPGRFQADHIRHRADYVANPYLRPMGIGLDLVGRRKDGHEISVEVSLNSVDVEGEMLIMAYVLDVSQRRQTEMKLARYTAELEQQNAELDAFAHTVAHDLKNPVAMILGFAELLNQENPVPVGAMHEALSQIIANGHRLNNIINELLLLAGVRKADLEMEPLDMFGIVEEAHERVAYLIKTRKAEIKLPYSWPIALGHGPWIEEVWANYLSNAIKYGGSPPHIELGATKQRDGMIRFWVKDRGAGISAEQQAKLFTPFTQIGPLRADGHGLGLSIVRRIIEKCHGQVGVISEVGAGSTFWFTLPPMVE